MIGSARRAAAAVVTTLMFTPALASTAAAQPRCPADAVWSGTVCIDKYEASLWYVPPEEKGVIQKIQRGQVTLAELIAAGVQLGVVNGDLAAYGCPFTGNGCRDVYAVSIPGVLPAGHVNWFQAGAAARNAHKRLPTNQEWQLAALGTPDGIPCNVDPGGVVAATGNAPGCVSDVGAFDMVGNVSEWVAEWTVSNGGCFHWTPDFGGDLVCGNFPTGVIRGGSVALFGGSEAGVFSLRTNLGVPAGSPAGLLGFRAVRDGVR